MRYKVCYKSVSGHCCFEASILDMEVKDEAGYYDNLGEFFNKEVAEKVCGLFNGGGFEVTDKIREEVTE